MFSKEFPAVSCCFHIFHECRILSTLLETCVAFLYPFYLIEYLLPSQYLEQARESSSQEHVACTSYWLGLHSAGEVTTRRSDILKCQNFVLVFSSFSDCERTLEIARNTGCQIWQEGSSSTRCLLLLVFSMGLSEGWLELRKCYSQRLGDGSKFQHLRKVLLGWKDVPTCYLTVVHYLSEVTSFNFN